MKKLKSIKLIIFVLVVIFPHFKISAKAFNTDSVLIELDEVIRNKSIYEVRKQKKITQYRKELGRTENDFLGYAVCEKLFLEYRSYKLDSAYFFAKLQYQIGNQLKNEVYIENAKLNIVDGLKGLAKLNEADSLLNRVNKNKVDEANYYHLKHSITLLRFALAIDETEVSYLNKRLLSYRDTISMINPKNSVGYVINRAETLKLSGKYKEALNVLKNFKETNREEAMNHATFLSSIADVYSYFNNKEACMYYLTLAALKDKIDCKKTYTSLQKLALLLNEEGDTERAYLYITNAFEDITSSNAKNRLTQVAEMMPIIIKAYKVQQDINSDRRSVYTLCIVALMLVLVIALFFLYKRNVRLNSLKSILDNKNEELKLLNSNLENLNQELSESNRIKERYIAQLFNLCSGYIENLEKFRVSIARKLKAGRGADVEKILSSPLTERDLKEFFNHFDSVFLNLFPTFVEDFNKLLDFNERIYPKEGELLSTELRIYALVKLGINDGAKIANFLHFSTQTVYNYRQRVRNKTNLTKEEFLKQVQSL